MCDALSQGTGRTRLSGARASVRIIGVGSPFGDDRLGWDAVDAVERSGLLDSYTQARVSVQRLNRPDASLLEALAAPGLVVLVDAMRSGAVPGTVREVDSENLEATGALVSTHGFGIESALQLAGTLGEIACEVRVLGIEMNPEGTPARPTPARTRRDSEEITRLIKELIGDFLRRGRHAQGADSDKIEQEQT